MVRLNGCVSIGPTAKCTACQAQLGAWMLGWQTRRFLGRPSCSRTLHYWEPNRTDWWSTGFRSRRRRLTSHRPDGRSGRSRTSSKPCGVRGLRSAVLSAVEPACRWVAAVAWAATGVGVPEYWARKLRAEQGPGRSAGARHVALGPQATDGSPAVVRQDNLWGHGASCQPFCGDRWHMLPAYIDGGLMSPIVCADEDERSPR